MIWFDLDNSPHVPLFRPVMQELINRNMKYLVTSREFAQTEELLKLWNIPHKLIGKHAGKNKINKVINLYSRSSQLLKYLREVNNILAVSHGSRTQVIAAYRKGINSIVMLDYEYTENKIFNYFSSSLLMPIYIPEQRLLSAGFNLSKVIRYKGFKEELYLKDFQPQLGLRESLDVSDDQIMVIIRPPSIVGNYHDNKSESLLIEAIKYFSANQDAVVIIVNRTLHEKKLINSKIKLKPNVRFMNKAVNGLQILFASDIAVSGGGTMNRESALLGTKTYSIFTGKRPYLDEYLAEQGKLKFIESTNDFKDIEIKRYKKGIPIYDNNLSHDITNILLDYENGKKVFVINKPKQTTIYSRT